MWNFKKAFLPLWVAALATATAPQAGVGFVIGSRRRVLTGRSLSSLPLDQDAQFEHDKFAFEGPVPGVGFVTHKHDVVFKNTTAWLDDFLEVVSHTTCTALSAATEAASGSHQLENNSFDLGMLPAHSRRGMQLDLRLNMVADGAMLLIDAFARRLSSAHIFVMGVDALPVVRRDRACAMLLGSAPPVFKIAAKRIPSSGLNAGDAHASTRSTIRLILQPAGLMEPFAAASWRHRVEPDIDSALAARGLSWSDFPRADQSVARELKPQTIASLNLNREGLGAAGEIVEPSIALKDWGVLRLSCENCSAYFSVVLDVELRLCGWLLGGVMSIGCDGMEMPAGTGYRLHFSAKLTVEAGASAGLRLATGGQDGQLTYDKTVPRTNLFTWDGPGFSFSIFGLPVEVRTFMTLPLRTRVRHAAQPSTNM